MKTTLDPLRTLALLIAVLAMSLLASGCGESGSDSVESNTPSVKQPEAHDSKQREEYVMQFLRARHYRSERDFKTLLETNELPADIRRSSEMWLKALELVEKENYLGLTYSIAYLEVPDEDGGLAGFEVIQPMIYQDHYLGDSWKYSFPKDALGEFFYVDESVQPNSFVIVIQGFVMREWAEMGEQVSGGVDIVVYAPQFS